MLVVHLHGRLRREFGAQYRFDARSAAEAVRALVTQLDGFREALAQGQYQVFRGPIADDRALVIEALDLGIGREMHIVPVAAGAKNSKGIAVIIVGVVLIAAAFYFAPIAAAGFAGASASAGTGIGGAAAAGAGASAAAGGLSATAFTVLGSAVTYGNIALFGAALVFSGVSSLLSAQRRGVDPGQFERPDQRPSFIYNGPVNVAEQGHPVPLVYGRAIVGSVVISAGIETVEHVG